MKITIELNEEELKSLIFGNYEQNSQQDARFGYDILYKSWYIADCILGDMKDVAQVYGFVSVAEFKELVKKRTGIIIAVSVLDKKQGWTLDMLYAKAHVSRMRNGYILELPKPLLVE